MKILEIELKGYKRLSLNKIETIKINPYNKFHWVLGTNGSGKSCLIKEISPLPAVPSNYHKGGFKKIILEHNGVIYKLISDFTGPKNLFHFIILKDEKEEELNPGHTSTVCSNLVFQHLGITKEFHELSVGLTEFDRLSPNDRKQLLTKISDTDYSFALSYFQKLLSTYRDTIGSVKTDQNRLVEAKAKLISKDEESLLIREIEELRFKAKTLMEVCPHPTTPFNISSQRLKELQNQICFSSKNFKQKLKNNRRLFPLPDKEFLQTKLVTLESEIMFLENSNLKSFEKLREIEKKLKVFQLVHNTDAVTLQNEILETQLELCVLEKDLKTNIKTKTPSTLLEEFDGWQRDLEHIVSNLIPDPTLELSQTILQESLREFQRGESFLLACEGKKEFISLKIKDIENCNHDEKVECPKCNYRWTPGKSPEDLRMLKEEKTLLIEKTTVAKSKMDNLKYIIQKSEAYFQGLDYLNNFIWTHESFKPFWDFIIYENIHKKNPETLLKEVLAFKQDLKILKVIEDVECHLKDLKHKKELLDNQGTLNINTLLETQKYLNEEISQVYDKREKVITELSYLKQKKSLNDFITNSIEEAKSWQAKSEACFKENFDHFQRDKLSDFILETNTAILAKEKVLRSVEIQKAQVEILENNLVETTEFSKVLKAAVRELSPTEGLIAKGLTGFINHFVGLVNGLIRKVWLYHMELIPILPNDDNSIELNYKFSVKVKDEIVPDISDCSSGQKEIINLAIRIVALSFLRLDNGPLFLDEFGARMDVAHKASAFEAVSNLLSTSNFTQIFMISHFEGSYNSSLEADITVLCPANIQLPSGLAYNQQTKII